ncbi:MAG: circularly permuted type 2 ATP-grasp protein [Dehalococcoidia bacterium]
MFLGPGNTARPSCARLATVLSGWDAGEFERRVARANATFQQLGITFTVYGDNRGTERLIPFDPIPRVIAAAEWATIEQGIAQRVRALNRFLHDVYHERQVLRDAVIPTAVVLGGPGYRRQMMGVDVPQDIYIHIAGIDVIRDVDGRFLVLEDNLRTPSGISYVLENRDVTTRILPELFTGSSVRPVHHYPEQLLANLRYVAPRGIRNPMVVLLTPGVHNSAYFEHSFLARRMGVPLVEGRDLTVRDGRVYMRTTKGQERVDVIYRRVDDEFLDPLAFRVDSMLGIPGIFFAYRSGNVTLVNAVGNGIADDKVIYRFVPHLIRYYLGEEPILDQVDTYLPIIPEDLRFIEQHAGDLVLKAAHESGGYGMLIGPQSTHAQREEYLERMRADPRSYLAQRTVWLSRAPCWTDGKIEGRHVDLRPFALYGDDITLIPGGLTRVALNRGSLVVNSSQGGGTKDTWVQAEEGTGDRGQGTGDRG